MKVFHKIIIGLIAAVVGFLCLGWWISPQDELQKADVIVAISGGDTEARTLEAIRLYKEGWAPRLLFSGAALDPLSPSNAEVMQEIGRAQGVPEADIAIAERATNTKENAAESEVIITAKDYNSIILVTSPYHQRRAHIEFQDTLGPGVAIINHSSEDEQWSDDWWFISPNSMYLTLIEGLKTGITSVRTLF